LSLMSDCTLAIPPILPKCLISGSGTGWSDVLATLNLRLVIATTQAEGFSACVNGYEGVKHLSIGP
jgi:hypothetical protein